MYTPINKRNETEVAVTKAIIFKLDSEPNEHVADPSQELVKVTENERMKSNIVAAKERSVYKVLKQKEIRN